MNRLLEVGNEESRPNLQPDLACSAEQIHYIFPYMYIRIGSTEVEHITCLTYTYQFIIWLLI
jgi:hypothetical protein